MKTKNSLFSRNLLCKIMLTLALVVGWNDAWGDDVYFNATADISGWTKSSINYRSWSDKNLYINSTGGTLTSNSEISFSTGETFVITAKGYNSTSTTPPQIIVYTSSDNGSNWSPKKTFSYENGDIDLSNGVYKDLVVSGIVGDYKIKLECNYILISCIKKVASSLPILSISPSGAADFGNVTADDSKVYKITNNTGASVNITSSISGDDVFSVSNVGTPITINNGDSEDFTISFDWQADVTKLGEKTATVTFTPNNGDDPFVISVSAKAKAPFELSETETPSLSTSNKSYLHLKYSVQDGWNTICMPFILYRGTGTVINFMDAIYGTGWKAYTLNRYNDHTLTFSKISENGTIDYRKPYLVYIETAPNHPNGVLLTDVYTYSTAASYTSNNGATFQGTYVRKDYVAEDNWYGITPSGKVMKAGTGAYVNGFRGYFTGVTPPSSDAHVSIVFEDDETTDLGFVKMIDPEAKDVYTLSGQKVEKAGKGIYIVNGRKVVIK